MPNESPLARNALTAAAAMLLVVLLGHPGMLLCVPILRNRAVSGQISRNQDHVGRGALQQA